MAKTGKSNAHLGVRHPFGAKHGTPLTGRPSPAAAHESLAERFYAKKPDVRMFPLPGAADAPLPERLYRESLADVVARHSRGDHSTLRPYTPEPDAIRPYYRMGVRPLDLPFSKGRYGKRVEVAEQHLEHMQFVGNDGKSNFGLTNSDTLLVESPEALKRYQVESAKYRKEYIDRARDELEAQWQTKLAEANQSSFGTALHRYSLTHYNCQHYFAEIIQRAQSYETREKPLVPP